MAPPPRMNEFRLKESEDRLGGRQGNFYQRKWHCDMKGFYFPGNFAKYKILWH